VSLTAVPVRSPLPGNVGLLTGVTGIVGAGTEYCAVYSSAGNVACWGSDQSGSNVFYPVTVQGPSGALSSIASVVGTVADTDTFCGLTTPQASNGREVWCWGSNYTSYTFGDGSTNSNATWNTASQVVNTADSGPMTQVSALFSGGNTALCAIVGSAANLDCWGQNEYGQLGNDTSSPIDYPVAVHGVNNSGLLSGVTGANGYGFTWCATYSGSSDAACWGFNSDANFGNGTQGGTSDFPLAVSAPAGESGSLAGVTHLGTDDLGSCAVLTSGGVDCWGFANYGVLGNGSDTNGSAIPAPVLGVGDEGTLGGVASMTGSSVTDRDSYCAVLTSKEAVCWGLGDAGELGSGGATLPICNDGLPCSTLPVAVVGTSGTGHLKKIKSILGVPVQAPRFGGSYCALLTTKKVDCWGGAPEGELGNGTTSSSPVPGPVFTAS
jgi:alpha-tubulin suppressor-like RCC1 family protein